jgi:hypothetical protein
MGWLFVAVMISLAALFIAQGIRMMIKRRKSVEYSIDDYVDVCDFPFIDNMN